MEPDHIDTSVISISSPPGTMDTNNGSAEGGQLENEIWKPTSSSTTQNATVSTQQTGNTDSPQLTSALEALLGGLVGPPTNLELPAAAQGASSGGNEKTRSLAGTTQLVQDAAPLPEAAEPTVVVSLDGGTTSADVFMGGSELEATQLMLTSSEPEEPTTVQDADVKDPAVAIGQETSLKGEPSTVSAGESQIEQESTISEPIAPDEVAAPNTTDVIMEGNGDEGEHPEWESDSSPIESSSDDSSDDSSSDDSEDGDNSYKLLSPEEQARILMADGGSDDEGPTKAKGSGSQLRTKNEVPEVVIPKPDVTISPEMVIINLGAIETIVENIALIKARTSGEYRVLESGSVLCLEDRSVIGVVAEPLGRVQQPLYSVLFTNAGEVKAAGLSIGTQVFYSEAHASYVFTQALKAFKGSDASNIHDEEVGDEEMEFSDDEAEQEYKRKLKGMKKGGGRGRDRDGSSGRGGHPLQQQHNASPALNYEEPIDGPYRPLTRPVGFANSLGHTEAPQEGEYSGGGPSRGHSRGGRGDRGRGRGDRGRGDRGRGNRGGSSNGYSQPPQNRPTSSHQSPPTMSSQIAPPSGFGLPPPPNFYNMPQQQFSPNQPQFPSWPQFSPPIPPQQQPFQQQPFQQPGFQQAFQGVQQMQQQMQNGWPNMAPVQMPNGAFFNPAFFGNQGGNNTQNWNQQNPPNLPNQRGGGNNGNVNGGRGGGDRRQS